tara:strand:- start:102 stop:449 length:348 start_codon:yes stop_codon:yes gene_type:complete
MKITRSLIEKVVKESLKRSKQKLSEEEEKPVQGGEEQDPSSGRIPPDAEKALQYAERIDQKNEYLAFFSAILDKMMTLPSGTTPEDLRAVLMKGFDEKLGKSLFNYIKGNVEKQQ